MATLVVRAILDTKDDIFRDLELPENACRSAGWFWKSRWLNELADKGDFKLLTKRINGGFNGYADRLALFNKAQQVLA
jgi:putative chitinase